MPVNSMRPTVVIGLGNVLMSDEGIGVHLVRALMARASAFPDVDFLDLGTTGMAVLHALAGRRQAIVLDCARMKASPGAIRRFTLNQVASVKASPRFSLHDGDLLELLMWSRKIGAGPEEAVIFGIQPAILAMGDALSPVLAARMDEYIRLIADELADPVG